MSKRVWLVDVEIEYEVPVWAETEACEIARLCLGYEDPSWEDFSPREATPKMTWILSAYPHKGPGDKTIGQLLEEQAKTEGT